VRAASTKIEINKEVWEEGHHVPTCQATDNRLEKGDLGTIRKIVPQRKTSHAGESRSRRTGGNLQHTIEKKGRKGRDWL